MFDAPSPQTRSGHNFDNDPLRGSYPITYRAGTLEAASTKMYFDGKLDREYLTQGFEVYNPDTKTRDKITAFTAYLIGVYYGSFSNGEGKGDIRFQSNLVANSKTDIMQSYFFIDGKRQVLAQGNYQADIKPALEKERRKGGFTPVMVAYIVEFNKVMAIHLTATAKAGFIKAIAASRGVPEYEGNLYGLTELTTEIWGFAYRGESEPVVFSDKDAKKVPETMPATRESFKVFFQPVIRAGVIRSDNPDPKVKMLFDAVAVLQNEFSEYIASEQSYLRGSQHKEENPQPGPQPQPSNTARTAASAGDYPKDTTDYTVATADFTEDLPF